MAIEIAQNLDAINMIRAQQNVVGRSIIGGARSISGNNMNQSDTLDILSEIRNISNKTFKAIKLQTETFTKLLDFEKQKERREREQDAELRKEQNVKAKTRGTPGSFKDQSIQNEEGLGFLGGLGLGALGTRLTGIFKGIKDFVDKIKKSRLITGLTKLGVAFGRFGPLGLIILGFSALVRYGGDLVKTLQPVLDGIKKTVEILQPITDIILGVADIIIKTGLREIGTALEAAFIMLNNTLSFVVDTFLGLNDILFGIVTGDFGKITDGFKKVQSAFSTLGDKILNAIINAVNGLIDALPFVPQKLKDKMKFDNVGQQETPEEEPETKTETKSTTENKDVSYVDKLAGETESQSDGGIVSQMSDPKQEEVKPVEDVIKPEKKPKVINMDQTSSATQVAEKVVGDPNMPPLGLNMYNTTGDTWEERADQWRNFKAALVQAEKDGSISKEELDFRVMKMMDEKDRLQRAKRMIDIKKQKAELKGETFDEASILGQLDADNAATQERVLAEEGMTEASFNQSLNNKLRPNVNKRDLTSGTGEGSSGAVITDAKQTIVQNSNVSKTDNYSGGINTSSGDNYFDRQTGSYAT